MNLKQKTIMKNHRMRTGQKMLASTNGRMFMICLYLALGLGQARAQEISPLLFGQNHWMAQGDENNRPGYINQLWPKVAESGIKMVRIGGGGYERKLPEREKLVGIIDSIHGIGAEPILQVPSHYSKEKAIELVRFFNKERGKKPIRYWSIGNEPLLRVRDDHEAMLAKLEEVYGFIMRLAPAMKSADPDIKILIYDGAGLPRGKTETLNYEAYEALCGGRLDVTGKDGNGNYLIDGITYHNYPNRLDYDRNNVIFHSTQMIREATRYLLGLIDKANKKNGRTGESKLLWGLTEINVNAGNPNREVSGVGCPSFLGGQFIAEIYGIGMENNALVVAPWCINETDRVRTDFGYIGLPMDFYPRSSYYHTQLMAQNMKGSFVKTHSNQGFVKTIGTSSPSEICIMILNQDLHNDLEFDIVLNKAEKTGKPLVINADLEMNKKISGLIPNQTTILYVLSISGEVRRKYTYSLEHNLKNLPPDVE